MSATLFVKFLGTALVVPAGYSAYSSGMLGGEFAADSDLDEGLASLAYIHMPDEDEEIEEPAVRAESESEVKAAVERAAESEVAADAEEAVGSKAAETEVRGDVVAEERTPKIIGDEKGVKKELPGKKVLGGLFGNELVVLLEDLAGDEEFTGSSLGQILINIERHVGQEVLAGTDALSSLKTAAKSIPYFLQESRGDEPSYAEKYGLTEKLKDLDEDTFLKKLNITVKA